MKKWRRVIIVLVVVVLVFSGLGTVGLKSVISGTRNIHRPCLDERPEDWGFSYGDYAELRLTTKDDFEIDAELFFAQGETKGFVVLTHGAADDACLEFMYPMVRPFVEDGFGVLAITMRNFGGSDGELTSFGREEWRDVAAAITWLQETYPDYQVFALGLSMGGGTTLIAESKGYADAVVLLNPYTLDVPAITWRLKTQYHIPQPVSWLSATLASYWEYGVDGMDQQPMKYAERYRPDQSTLIICGSSDQILPPNLCEELNDVLPNSRLEWVDGRHNLVREDEDVLNQVIALALDFFNQQVALMQ